MRELRTNTATRVTVGPFMDETDAVTPQTALTVTSEKLTLIVDTGGVPTLVLDVAPTASGGANDMVHVTGDDAGFYDLELAAANLNYRGPAILALTNGAAHRPISHEFMIISAQEYDRKYGTQSVVQRGTLTSVGPQEATLAAQTVVTDLYKGARLEIPEGETGGGQVRYITTHTNANPPVATLDGAWTTQPTGAAYILTPESIGATAEDIVNLMYDEPTTGHTTAGTYGKAISDILDVTGTSGVEVSATGATALAAAVFARVFSAAYGNLTFDEIVKLIAAVLLGKASGLAGTTATYRNLADTGDGVVATVDADGNRSAVTRTP